MTWPSTDTLRKIQSASGLAFTSFLALHLPTTISATMGPYGYNEALTLFRNYYQNRIIETGLAVSAVSHIAAGFILFKRRNPAAEQSELLSTRLQRYTGVALTYIVPIHVAAVRLGSLFAGWKPSEYDTVRATLTGIPSIFFFPYYFILSASGSYHTAQGILKSLERFNLISHDTCKTISESKIWYTFIGLLTSGFVAGMIGFATIPGIPENAAYWKIPHVSQWFQKSATRTLLE